MDYSRYQRIVVRQEGHLARLTLNRPEQRNAIDRQMHLDLMTIFVDLADDPEVHVILLTGAGDAFCVGGDMNKAAERPHGDFAEEGEALDPGPQKRMWNRLLDCDKPIICAINGHCIGLGASLALLCDITIMADTAKIADTHVKVGSPAGDGGVILWPMLIGPAKAKDFLMRGTLLTGAEAERIGLVNYCVPKDQVMSKAMEIANELLALPPLAVRWTKAMVNKIVRDQMNLIFDASYPLDLIAAGTADSKEAVKAFLEKRKGLYHGR
jgi:enoyl-CoA hydratase